MKVMIQEASDYFLFADPDFADYHSGPVGDIPEETFGRWQATAAAWKGLQTELQTVYSAWSQAEFLEREGFS